MEHWNEETLHWIFVLYSREKQACTHTHIHETWRICCLTLVSWLYLLNASGLIKRKTNRRNEETKRASERGNKSTKNDEKCTHLWNRFNDSQSVHIYLIDCLVMFTLSSSNPSHAHPVVSLFLLLSLFNDFNVVFNVEPNGEYSYDCQCEIKT